MVDNAEVDLLFECVGGVFIYEQVEEDNGRSALRRKRCPGQHTMNGIVDAFLQINGNRQIFTQRDKAIACRGEKWHFQRNGAFCFFSPRGLRGLSLCINRLHDNPTEWQYSADFIINPT